MSVNSLLQSVEGSYNENIIKFNTELTDLIKKLDKDGIIQDYTIRYRGNGKPAQFSVVVSGEQEVTLEDGTNLYTAVSNLAEVNGVAVEDLGPYEDWIKHGK